METIKNMMKKSISLISTTVIFLIVFVNAHHDGMPMGQTSGIVKQTSTNPQLVLVISVVILFLFIIFWLYKKKSKANQ